MLEAVRFQIPASAADLSDVTEFKKCTTGGCNRHEDQYSGAQEALEVGFYAGYCARGKAEEANGGSHAAFKSGYQAAEDEQADDEHRAWKKDTSASGGSDLSTLQAHVTPGTTRGYKMDGRRRQQRIGAVAAVAPAPVPR